MQMDAGASGTVTFDQPTALRMNTMNLGDVTLSGGFQAGHFPHIWDLTAGDMTISFTANLTGVIDDLGGSAHAWAELGVHEVGYGDFNPTWGVEGAGVWLATDYDWTVDTFNGTADDNNNGILNKDELDLDDKLILQKAGGQGEGDYFAVGPFRLADAEVTLSAIVRDVSISTGRPWGDCTTTIRMEVIQRRRR